MGHFTLLRYCYTSSCCIHLRTWSFCILGRPTQLHHPFRNQGHDLPLEDHQASALPLPLASFIHAKNKSYLYDINTNKYMRSRAYNIQHCMICQQVCDSQSFFCSNHAILSEENSNHWLFKDRNHRGCKLEAPLGWNEYTQALECP